MKSKIEIAPIKWDETSENAPTLNCPVCGKVWEKDGENSITPCEHLRFRAISGVDPEFFGEWNHDDFDEEEVCDGKNDEINAIYEFSEMGMSCGPVFTSVLYGVKK
jgi:hypothetical protein